MISKRWEMVSLVEKKGVNDDKQADRHTDGLTDNQIRAKTDRCKNIDNDTTKRSRCSLNDTACTVREQIAGLGAAGCRSLDLKQKTEFISRFITFLRNLVHFPKKSTSFDENWQ